MTCGTNFSPRSEAYNPHPAHQQAVQEFIGPI